MEKLQAAIKKAREQREGAVPPQNDLPVRPPPRPDAEPVTEKRNTTGPAPIAADDDSLEAHWDKLPLLEISPRQAQRKRVFLDGASPEATYFDKLRTKVLQQCRDNGWRRVVITSATKSCGKTTIATNLAASFTRQRDRRMILHELDMRRPEMCNIFRHEPDCGLSDVLEGQRDFARCAARLGANVAIAMNRARHPNPAELLLSDRTPEVLDEIDAKYAPDLVLFDAPPLLSTDDTMAFLKHVDCALIVAAAEKSTTDQIDVVEKEIAEQTNVMGVVLNQCTYFDDRESYYGYR